MQGVVEGYLARLRVGDGKEFGGVAQFPVFRDGESPLHYLVLGEALAGGSVEVRERPSASVPELWLVNRSDSMVLVMDGEEIIGGKQNRIVNASFLIAARSEVMLPVTCVEHGRWHDVAPRFMSGEAAPAMLRRDKEMQVKASLRAGARHVADQHAVWDAIAAKQQFEGTRSQTGAMNDIYQQKAKDLAEYQQAFPPVDGAVGMVVALNGRITGGDLFDQPATATALWPKLVRSYALDAVPGREEKPVSRDRASRLIKRLDGARVEQFPSVALGQDLRLEGDGANAAALVYEGVVVHMGLFRIHRRRAGGDATGMARAAIRRRMQGGPNHGIVF